MPHSVTAHVGNSVHIGYCFATNQNCLNDFLLADEELLLTDGTVVCWEHEGPFALAVLVDLLMAGGAGFLGVAGRFMAGTGRDYGRKVKLISHWTSDRVGDNHFMRSTHTQAQTNPLKRSSFRV